MSHETALDWFERSHGNSNLNQGIEGNQSRERPQSEEEFELSSIWEDATDAFLYKKSNRSLNLEYQSRISNKEENESFEILFQEGTNISFIDELWKETSVNDGTHTNTSFIQDEHNKISTKTAQPNNIVLEIAGGTGMGKTALSLSLASSYIAATSNLLLPRIPNGYNALRPPPITPQVIILDSEYGVHTCNLVSSVRASMIRFWEKQKLQQNQYWNDESVLEKEILSSLSRIHISHPRDAGHGFVSCLEAIRSTLDEIRDKERKQLQKQRVLFASQNNNMINRRIEESSTFQIPFLESAKQKKLNEESQTALRTPSPPIMLIIDSLNAFEYTDCMLEEIHNSSIAATTTTTSSNRNYSIIVNKKIQSGLSGKNDFSRQLLRFLKSQNRNIIVVATKSIPNSYSTISSLLPNSSYGDSLWRKCVTHNVSLQRVSVGTNEEKMGYEFVALIQNKKKRTNLHEEQQPVCDNNSNIFDSNDYESNNANGIEAGNLSRVDSHLSRNLSLNQIGSIQIFPFSITAHGIIC